MAENTSSDPMAAVPRRTSRDPDRASISTPEAAERLHKSRQRIFQMLGEGKIDGYGIASKQRTRWFVYVDSLPAHADESQGSAPTPAAGQAPPQALQDAFAHVLNAQERYDRAVRHARNVRQQHPEASADLLAMLDETWQMVTELTGIREQTLTPATAAELTEEPR